jgi:hypothetical protein
MEEIVAALTPIAMALPHMVKTDQTEGQQKRRAN